MLRRIVSYIRYDLKEILNPSGLPDPPGTLPYFPKFTFQRLGMAIREGALDYIDRWRTHRIRPVHQKPVEEKVEETKDGGEEDNKSIRYEIAEGFKRTGGDIRPLIQRLYYTRAKALSQTVQAFAEGFREAMEEVKKKP